MEPSFTPAPIGSIFDSHAHYDDGRFEENRNAMLTAQQKDFGVAAILNCGSDIASSKAGIALAEQYPFMFAAVGIHPEAVGYDTDVEAIRRLSQCKKVVAIGEIGLDYYWSKENADIQKDLFAKQLKLANELGFPVVIHDREAHEDTMTLLRTERPRGVLHCFSGSPQMAEEVLKLGLYLGIGGALTFKNAKKLPDVVRIAPLESLLLETDAPYMAPEPFRGKTNQSGYLSLVAQRIAEIKQISPDEVMAITKTNACRLFGIPLLP